LRPAKRAFCSASANATAQASSSSFTSLSARGLGTEILTGVCRPEHWGDGIMTAESSPT
jgi:hypothetical protein